MQPRNKLFMRDGDVLITNDVIRAYLVYSIIVVPVCEDFIGS
jgi:hypothetical protein